MVGPARREVRPPWVDVRLTFADGARIDVLAVVHEGRIAIEDAQADPPLALDGFAALASVIEAPLQDACKVVADQDGGRGGRQDIPPAPDPAAAAEAPVPDLVTAPVAEAEPEPEPQPAPDATQETPPEPTGRHRADPAARGAAGRRTVADIYRAAQRDGLDPVLAVMSATGFSRRKSLRLIAGARDEGHLSPRHHRR
ncbi:DUF6214 family protein [Streptomyces liangshanensis]|uniref:DUF6214 family protein n=1 Tax=Streptomyces liangshanensis TaxID=2717324 RepID=UPI003C7D2217